LKVYVTLYLEVLFFL